jgi:hypothetical protein
LKILIDIIGIIKYSSSCVCVNSQWSSSVLRYVIGSLIISTTNKEQHANIKAP